MRFLLLMVFCAVLATTLAEPEPKKYKNAVKKNKITNTTLTDDERKFLREVEAKFGIKSDVKDEKNDEAEPIKVNVTQNGQKLPFPAVIAIEIVNDTDSKSKGKRTIDANLGYGYKTNSGYSYSYFGKPAEDKGRFMIYPYSQEDIPPGRGHNAFTEVEITPSRAFELVEEKEGYDYPKPSTEFKDYNNVKGLVSPPPAYQSNGHSQGTPHSFIPSTLFTTYNGQEFSGLSGKFPKVMPNYLVDPSQLLKTPEFQNVGLTNDHLRVHGSNIADQPVVPVLVLRIPSSSLKNPTAELFANLPSNYPFSNSLNNVNLQELVNQYFKKIGYSFAPQVMNYHDSIQASHGGTTADVPPNFGRQHYASPQIQPTYTQVDHSGVQYSAVQPVMARYPSSYTRYLSHGHTLYQMPQQQKYEYRYQYVPKSLPQTYYVQSQYQQPAHESIRSSVSSGHSSAAEVQYASIPQVSSHAAAVPETYEYRTSAQVPSPQVQSHGEPNAEYEYPQHQVVESASPSYEHIAGTTAGAQEYSHHQEVPKETIAVIPSQSAHAEISSHSNAESQNYHYQQNNDDSDSHGLPLTENYPSKDHTIATVLPVSYSAKTPNVGAVQTVSYVTPMPFSSKYRSPYRIMVPQTFLMNPSTEKVAYVNSHSVSAFPQQDYNPEAEYTVGPHYVPPVSRQKPPSYPKNYHSHPKRMAKPEKQESQHMHRKNERNEKKKST